MKSIKSIRGIKGIKSFLEKNFFCSLLILVTAITLFGLLHSGLPITHDGQDHVARIANFYQNLQEGVLIPRWAGNLNWGYGHPILMFLYPLPSYVTSFIHFLGFSFVDSVKIFFGLAFIASGFTMYVWLKEWLSREAIFIGAMLYMFAPYRFVDLYVRGAIGEHAAFVFPPLVLYFLFKLSKGNVIPSRAEESHTTKLLKQHRGMRSLRSFLGRDDKSGYWYLLGGSLSLAGLILAHNAISLMFLPIIFLYAVFLLWQSKRKKFLVFSSLFVVIFGFALAAFFWLPALMEGKYTLRDIVTQGSVNDRFSSLGQLFYGAWSYGGTGQLSVQVGLLHWLLVFASIPFVIYLKKKKDKNWIVLSTSLVLFFFTLFLITPYSQAVWENVSTLQKFQFPWRFLSLAVFLSAVIGAIVMNQLVIKLSSYKVIKYLNFRLDNFRLYNLIIILFVLLVLFINKDYWHAKGYLQKPESFYTGIYDSTTDTGESAPIWSVRFMEKRPKGHMEIVDGPAPVGAGLIEVERTSTRHVYSIETSARSLMRENTLYFPGWKVFVDGKEVPVEFQSQHNRGIMTFFVDEGKHDVEVKFEETKLRLLADVLSGASLLVLIILGIIRIKRNS